MKLGEQLELLRQAELIHAADGVGDDSEDNVAARALTDDARAESANTRCVGEIDISTRSELLELLGSEKSGSELLGLRRMEWLRLLPNRLQKTVTAPDRRRVDAQMDIGSSRLLSNGKVVVNVTQVCGIGRSRIHGQEMK